MPAAPPPIPYTPKPKETPKEAVIGLIISFVIVLIFRGFIFETFHIPTGSMAPTLRGAHMQFTSPQSGFTWAVNPWSDPRQPPTSTQGTAANPVRVSDPATGVPVQPGMYPLRSGDRIAVLKYNWFHHPRRWDVIVFKMPENPSENYIKRLVGLPNEDLWLVDGDVFARERREKAEPSPSPLPQEGGESEGWHIARKPRYIQDDVWWTIHSSELEPLQETFDGLPWRSPWNGDGWTHEDHGVIAASSAQPDPLTWDNNLWPITDFSAYNQMSPWAPSHRETQPVVPIYPTSDLRVRAGVEPDGPDATVRFTIEAREQRFVAEIHTGGVRYAIEPLDGSEPTVLNAKGFDGFPAGKITEVEFLHVDQSLEVRINGVTHGRMTYDWSPLERLRHSTTLDDAQLDAALANPASTELSNQRNSLGVYTQPRVAIQTSGAPVALHNVGLDRDLYYQPAERWNGASPSSPGLATHPQHLAHLGEWEFFAAGDNSASSRDSRLWDAVNPWVEAQSHPPVGLVPGDMLMGEAVVVFWPAANSLQLGPLRIPFVPDVGRVRLIK